MNRLVEHIHRDHGERDGVQAFAVHPVSLFHLVVFVFLRDWIFFSDFSHNFFFFFSRAESSQKEQNGTTKRKMETFGPAVRTLPYPIPFLPSLPSAQQHSNNNKQNNRTHRRRNSLRRISHLANIGKTTMVEREISQCDVGCE